MTPKRIGAIVPLLALWLAGCGWRVTGPLRTDSGQLGQVAESALLKANDGAVEWGGGQMGTIVQRQLLASGAFAQVYYPIEPRERPALQIAITASGKVNEDVGGGTLKAIVIGLFLFAPVGLIRFDKDFTLDATVVVTRDGHEPDHFAVNNTTHIAHTMFSDPGAYEAEAREEAFGDLAKQIVDHLHSSARQPRRTSRYLSGGLCRRVV